jgi:drug/metabolite transporter (DMT)-like permease
VIEGTKEVPRGEPSVAELLGALARDTSILVRQEVQLASKEVTDKTLRAATAGTAILAGGAIVHAGLIALMAAVIVGLGNSIPVWLSAVLVGLVAAGAGYALMQRGVKALKAFDASPQQTIKTLKDDAVWAKEQLR